MEGDDVALLVLGAEDDVVADLVRGLRTGMRPQRVKKYKQRYK